MNNKGFTLIELLAVIVILIAISAVSVASVSSSLKRNDENECELQAETVKNAAKIYFSTHSVNENERVSVESLINNNLLEEDNVNRYKTAEVGITDNGFVIYGECR